MRTHELQVSLSGLTHVQEQQVRIVRRSAEEETGVVVDVWATLRGGRLVNGVFDPSYADGLPTEVREVSTVGWTPTRRADFQAFQAEYEAVYGDKPLEERFVACALAYFQLMQLGERPVEEPEPEPGPAAAFVPPME